MTSKDLFKELNNIDDNLIEEASDCGNAMMSEEAKLSGAEQPVVKKKVFTNSNIFKITGIVAAACLVVALGLGIGYGISKIDFGGNNELLKYTEPAINKETIQDIGIAETGVWYNTNELVYLDNRLYRHWNDTTAEGLAKGEKIGEVVDYDKNIECIYKGCPIYSIEGVKSLRRILVESEGELILFSLHENLTSPDIREMFKLYGVWEASDIQSVKLEWNPQGGRGDYQSSAVLTDSAKIETLYNILKTLEQDIEGYNKLLDEMAAADLKEWRESGGGDLVVVETASEGGGKVVEGYSGTKAFNDRTHIEIFTNEGEKLNFSYYPKMGYLDRNKATKELVDWIKENTK